MTARQEQEPIVEPIVSVLRRVAKDHLWGAFELDGMVLKDLADALIALDTAVKGCGKRMSAGASGLYIPDPIGRYACQEFDLCIDCEIARDAAIRTLLGRTE